MKLGYIKSLFWELVGGEAVASPQVTSDLLLTWANMGVVDLATASRSLQAEVLLPCTANVQEYTLPADCERVWRAAYDGYKLSAVSKWDLQQSDPVWDEFTGVPRRYYLNGINNKVGLWPIPTSNSIMQGLEIVGLGLHLYYDQRPILLEDDDSEPALPTWCHHAILFYLLKMAYSMIGVQRVGANAMFWRNRYEEVKRSLIARNNRRAPVRFVVPDRLAGSRLLAPPRYPEFIPDPEA